MGLKKLKKQAEDNTSVTKGTNNNQEVLKVGTPNDHSRKHLTSETVVGASVGSTINMDNYESLRVDVWLSDTVKEDETVEQAYERILGVIDSTLKGTVESYSE